MKFLAIIISIVIVNYTAESLQDNFKFVSSTSDNSSAFNGKLKPVTKFARQYISDENIDLDYHSNRPDHYDFENDPDPIIENLPPKYSNLGFLANLSGAQLHDLITEGLKYQQIANGMINQDEETAEVAVDFNYSEEAEETPSDKEENNIKTEHDSIEDESYEGPLIVIQENKQAVLRPEVSNNKTSTTKTNEIFTTESLKSTAQNETTITSTTTLAMKLTSNRIPIKTLQSSSASNLTTLSMSMYPVTEVILTTTDMPRTTQSSTIKFKPTYNKSIKATVPLSTKVVFLASSEIDESIGEITSKKPIKSKLKVSEKPTNKPPTKPTRITTRRPLRIPIRIIKKNQKQHKGQRPHKLQINHAAWDVFQQSNKYPVRVPTEKKICSYDCQCGVSTSRRIVGGSSASKNEFPWVASLLYKGRIECAGSVFNSLFVISAAHCFHYHKSQLYTIKLLQYERQHDDPKQVVIRKITKVFLHPNYNIQNGINDIALIRMNKPIDFSKTPIRPICLPNSRNNFVGYKGVIAGWGTIKQGGKKSQTLKKVKVSVISNKKCSAINFKRISSNMICTGNAKQDSCQGDIGGPLMVVEDRRYKLAGIISNGKVCSRSNRVEVYIRISKILNWIYKTASSGCYCN